jgi:5'-3' exonuclease
MTDYITEAGTIYWDRAEPFINMLGEHELESFKMRIDSIKHAQMERIVSFEGDFNSVRSEVVDRKTVIKNKVRAAINEKKVRKIVQLKNK